MLWSKDNIYIIKTLREFQYIDEGGRDQGASIRSKATALTELLQDDDRLRRERLSQKKSRRRTDRPADDDFGEGGSRRRHSPANGRSSRNRGGEAEDDELQRALEESRRSAAEDEQRRKHGETDDDDLRKAIMLSKEEDQQRFDNSNDFFAPTTTSQPNLIDISQSQPPLQIQYTAQPIYVQQQQQQPQVDLFGSYQQPVTTGYVENMYATGQNYASFPNQNQYGYNQQGLQQQPTQQQASMSFFNPEPVQQAPLQPLKTGSNNPFAQLSAKPAASTYGQDSMSQIQYQQQQQQQQDELKQQQQQQQAQYQLQAQQQQSLFSQPAQTQPPLPQKTAFTGQSSSHLDELNTMLATGEGLDTYGNTGDVRIPSQHTRTAFVNSQLTGGAQRSNGTTNNPFVGQQYTGVVTTNPIQPAFTGYGFGNAQQSQQAYQQSFQPQQQQQQQQQQGHRANQSLIDI